MSREEMIAKLACILTEYDLKDEIHGLEPWVADNVASVLAALSSAPPDLDEMRRRWSRCVERSDRQQAALEAWNDYMGEQFSEGPESDALHPRAAAIWRQVREALASVPAPETPAPVDPGGVDGECDPDDIDTSGYDYSGGGR